MKNTKNWICYADELAQVVRDSGTTNYNDVHANVQAKVLEHHPTYLGIVTGVNYFEKSDRYVVKFDRSSAKCTNEVAAFLLTNDPQRVTGPRPVVYAHMSDGVIDEVLLLFVSRS